MARLLILGGNRHLDNGSVRYRGVYRNGPDYQSKYGPESPINRAFARYCEDGGQSLVLSNINFARELVSLYGALKPAQIFDLVEAVSPDKSPEFPGTYLGCDIACGGVGQSMLSWDMDFHNWTRQEALANEPLIRLVEDHFRPKLNRYGLFENIELARFCLGSLTSINRVFPAYFWSKGDNYEVTALYLIDV